MKKKITHPDGIVEELEGSAEEIATVERGRLAEGEKAPKKGKRLLNEEERKLIREALQEAKEQLERKEPLKNVPNPWNPWPVGDEPWNRKSWTIDRIILSPPDDGSDCAFVRFMKRNPNHSGALGLVCNCRRCSVWCGTLSDWTTNVFGNTRGTYADSTVVTNEMRPEYAVSKN